MKLWPVRVWEEWRAGHAQQRFLALAARPWPPTQRLWLRRPGRPPRLVGRMEPTRLRAAQYGNLHGSVGVELPLGPTEALRLASYRLRADWERPLSPDGRRRWAEAWLQLARRA